MSLASAQGGIADRPVAVDAAGRVTVAGVTATGVAVVRYTSGGSLDTTFGAGGVLSLPADSATYDMRFAARPTGLVLLIRSPNTRIVAITPDGALDSTWASGGILTMNGTYYDVATDGDKVLVAGPGAPWATLNRYTATGAPDSAFGNAGVLSFQQPFNLVYGVDVRGSTYYIDGYTSGGGMAVARLSNTGVFDSSFGVNGLATTGTGACLSRVGSEYFESDSIVLVGSDGCSGDPDALVAHLHTNGSLDTSFGVNGILDLGHVSGIAAGGDLVIGGFGLGLQPDGGLLVLLGVYDGQPNYGVVRVLSQPATGTGNPTGQPNQGGTPGSAGSGGAPAASGSGGAGSSAATTAPSATATTSRDSPVADTTMRPAEQSTLAVTVKSAADTSGNGLAVGLGSAAGALVLASLATLWWRRRTHSAVPASERSTTPDDASK
jgi:uncharacterized delta-60 repeat protein